MRAIVRNVKSGVFYEYLGENRFKNMITGAEGVVSDEKAREVFRINAEATLLINEYPKVEDLIRKLELICVNP